MKKVFSMLFAALAFWSVNAEEYNKGIPDDAIFATGYMSGQGVTFIPGNGCIRAPWLAREKPTDLLSFHLSCAGKEWKSHTMTYTVQGSGSGYVVFHSDLYKEIPTWCCYKDITLKVNDTEPTAPSISCLGKTISVGAEKYSAAKQNKHTYFHINYKNGDRIEISFKYKTAGKFESDYIVDETKIVYTEPELMKPFPKEKNEYRILFKGNSITRHGPAPQLKWDHTAGMAATTEARDYAHLFGDMVRKDMPGKKVTLVFGAKDNSSYSDDYRQQADLVIVQNGEHHISSGELLNAFPAWHRSILDKIKTYPSKPRVICIGVWCPGNGKEYNIYMKQMQDQQRAIAKEYGHDFVSVEKYACDPSCSGWGENGGVQWHPNDKGMAGYAAELYKVWKNGRRKTVKQKQ